jgi:predicted phage terminase large subunit-like protein
MAAAPTPSPLAPGRGRPRKWADSWAERDVDPFGTGPHRTSWIDSDPKSAYQRGIDVLSASLEITPDQEEVRVMERDLRAFSKEALPLFVPGEIRWGWCHDAITDHLEAVSAGQIRNLIVDLPPRCLKSSLVSVVWPSWEWIAAPHLRYLFSSYDLDLTTRDNDYARRVIKSGWFQARWADRFAILSSSDAKRLFENDQRGRRLATSVRSRATGEGGDRLVCDDPHDARKVESDSERKDVIKWWLATMSSRVNSVDAAKVITAQRTHHADLVGHVWAEMLAGGEPYELLILPMEYDPKLYVRAEQLAAPAPRTSDEAVWDGFRPAAAAYDAAEPDADEDEDALLPDDEDETALTLADFELGETDAAATVPDRALLIPRTNGLGFGDPREVTGELLIPEQWDADFVKRQKRNLGPIAYGAQYQQVPTPAEGGQFKEQYWRRYNFGVMWHQGLRPSMIFVDSSYGTEGGDPTGVSVWGTLGGRLYVMAAAELELETPDLRARLRDIHARWRVPFMVEKKANGIALIQDLRRGSDDDMLPSLPVMEYNPDGMSKESRAYSVVPYVAGGLVYLPEGADWTDHFIRQHKEFPKGRHDDLVDTTAMAICWLALRTDDIRELIGRPIRAPYGMGASSGAGLVGGLAGGARALGGRSQPYWRS